jgi:hypothetical protein
MLKITYLENDLYLEYLHETVEDWIALRVVLALRMGHRLVVERNTASLLLPINLVKLSSLATAARQEEAILLARSDAEYIEVSLQGAWVSSNDHEAEGVFVTMLHPGVEQLLFRLWQASQVGTSSVWR